MKKFIFLSFLFVACQGTTSKNTTAQNNGVEVAQIQADTLLNNIQGKIYNSFVQSMMTQKATELDQLETGLEKLHQQKKQNLIQYWRAYLAYYQAIYSLKMSEKDISETYTDKGIELLEDLNNKNSEDYALLALMQSFSIQFKMGIKAPFIASSVKKNAESAMSMDKENLRGFYVYASSDFYTPEQYGGGKEAEQYLRKAIALPAQKITSTYLPSWGKEEAYEMLIKFYIKKENWNEAKKYFKEANEIYPNSYVINQLASKLVGK